LLGGAHVGTGHRQIAGNLLFHVHARRSTFCPEVVVAKAGEPGSTRETGVCQTNAPPAAAMLKSLRKHAVAPLFRPRQTARDASVYRASEVRLAECPKWLRCFPGNGGSGSDGQGAFAGLAVN